MFSIIVAYDKNHCIGARGRMAWKIPGELTRFKDLTTGHIVVMGRKTYDAIGHPLPNRKNIVVSRNFFKHSKNCTTINDFGKFLEKYKNSKEEIFITGGAEIYQQALPYVQKFYITEIDMEVQNGDAYFPKLDFGSMKKTYQQKVDGEIPFTYLTFEKTKNLEKT